MLQFMGDHPIVTVIIVIVFADLVLKMFGRMLRIVNLWKNGYPPPHCDADGDFRKEGEEG